MNVLNDMLFQLKCIKEHLNFIKKESPSVEFDIEVLDGCIFILEKYDRSCIDYIDGANELATRLKDWFINNSNYWFSHSVNTEIDGVLEEMENEFKRFGN